MEYNRQTRKEMNQSFIKNHSPSTVFILKNGVRSKEIFEVITGLPYSYDEHQQKVYSDLQKSMDGYEYTPAKFFKDNYQAVVSLCAGSKAEENLLYRYFDKLNKFPYSLGISRRSVRTSTYIDPIDSIKKILYASYHIQIYNTSLDRYLMDDMGPRELDYKKNSGMILGGLSDLIAAHLDGGDTSLKEALIKIITGENNSAFITVDIIKGIIKSDDSELHRLLGQLLVAARLQEGLRQAICENMDCGTAEAFKTLFEVIENNNLIRFSSVRRAVATWIGILDPDSLVRTSDRTFRLMKQALAGTREAMALTDSDDAMSIVVGLWGLGFYEAENALNVMNRFAEILAEDPDLNISVTTYPNSVLGSSNDMLSGMPTGLTDLFYNTLSCYPWLEGAQKFNAVTAPFLWDSQEEFQAFLDSDTAQQWFEEAAQATGVRVLAARGELPPRQLTANVPVENADDFAGLKIRTAESALVQETMKRLGATPVVVPLGDLYMALSQGTVDAQENNFITVRNSSLYEVQDYFMETDYIRDVSAIFISETVWQQMSSEQQAAVKEAAKQAVEYEAEQVAQQMDETMEFLNEHMTYVEIDVQSIQDKLGEDFYQELDAAGDLWPTGTMDEIMAFKDSYTPE